MNASSGPISQRKIALIMLFFELTSSATYGWRGGDDAKHVPCERSSRYCSQQSGCAGGQGPDLAYGAARGGHGLEVRLKSRKGTVLARRGYFAD